MKRPNSISVHAWERRAQRAPRACHPNFGVPISRAQARKLGVGRQRNGAKEARARRTNRAIRRDKRQLIQVRGKASYFCTATACWVVRRGIAITCIPLDDEALASLLVWAACGVWP